MKRKTLSITLFFLAAVCATTFVGCQKEKDPVINEDADDTISSFDPYLKGGEFSVSDTRKVRFSKSNLIFNKDTWRFAEHQYDCDSSHDGSQGVWDYFGWSTAATNYGMSTSEDAHDFSGNFVDWGSAVAATFGAGWRTLTHAEWDYLINKRANALMLVGAGMADGVPGLVLLPDGWKQCPEGCSFTYGIETEYADNSYSDAQWAQMEAAGAVFLPAAGFRNGTDAGYMGVSGYYWSSSPSDGDEAYYLYFFGTHLFPEVFGNRSFGFSVRLTRYVK